MQFDAYGNVVAHGEIEGGQRSSHSESASERLPRKDRKTSRFLSMNSACAQFADPPNLVKEPTDNQEDDSIVLTEKDWLSFVTCSVSMLQLRDQICRFADDVLGFGDLKLSGTHTGGDTVSDGLLSDLLELLAEDHWEKQKKKNPKARKKKKTTLAKNIDKDTILCDFGTKTDYFRVSWFTLRYLMKWEGGGWHSSSCVDFLAELVNLSLGHAPGGNVYPKSLMANSFTGLGLVPQYGDEDRIPLMTDRFTPDFEESFLWCARKVWFPKVKTNVKKSLYCYKAIDLPMPKIAFSVNCHGNHWETLCVDPESRHVFSLDPYHLDHDRGDSQVNWYRRWASKYFGMYQKIMNGDVSPYAGPRDMIVVWDPNEITIKRRTLAAYIGSEPSSFSHGDVIYSRRVDIPAQHDARKCSLYSWHFAYCFLFGCKCDRKFDPERMRRQLLFS